MSDSHELQHVNVKLFFENAEGIDMGAVINVFHAWIQDQRLEDQLIDVADYRHVPSGPGVILIGHHGQYSVDNAEGELGVLYNRRTPVTEQGADQVAQAVDLTRDICRRLAAEESLAGKVGIDTSRLQLMVNDRLLAPNDQESYDRLLPQFAAGLTKALGEQEYQFERDAEARRRLTVNVKVPGGFSI